MTDTYARFVSRGGGGPRAARSLMVAAALLAAPLLACSTDKVLQVEDPDVARPQAVSDSSALPALLAGAIGDFGVAYNGGGDFNQITLAGELSDELINTETFPTRIEVDQRVQQYQNNGSLSGLFYLTQQARVSADRAAAAFGKFSANNVGRAEALNIAALTLVLFAENYCGAVPLSRQLENGSFEYGAPLTTEQLLVAAIAKADSALAVAAITTSGTGSAADKTTQTRLARIVKARALLDLNRPTDAAAAIGGESGVPTTFQYLYNHSETTGRQNNGTWGVTRSVGRFGVADREGSNGLPFRSDGDLAGSARDPRVVNQRRTSNRGFGFDGVTPQWEQLKYPLRSSPVVIADGVEARLIEAEAALRSGNYTNALGILNGLRSNAALLALRGYTGALPALPAVSGQSAQADQLFRERAYWLYLTSHRLGDLRRLIKFYGRPAESVFPTGPYHKSGVYGTDVNSPVPQAEENNPNFQRAACQTNKA